MLSIFHRPRRAVLAGILVLSSGGVLAATATPQTGPASCDIRSSTGRGGVELTAVADAEESVTGTYSFQVKGGGTNIDQGGPFRAAPGRPATLGTVMLGANGSSYRAVLDVTVDGETISCSKRVGGF